jgi:hypothetical protein
MALLENTSAHDSLEEAEDSLAGLRRLPGFLYGYVRLPARDGGCHETVTIFDCVAAAELGRGQRRVHLPAV